MNQLANKPLAEGGSEYIRLQLMGPICDESSVKPALKAESRADTFDEKQNG